MDLILWGDLVFTKKTNVNAVNTSSNVIVVTDTDALNLNAGDVIEIKGSTDAINDFKFRVQSVTQNGTDIEISVDEIEEQLSDKLLPIHIDHDCDSCQITDPYSFVASVVLPYWPDRFIDLDYRRFMERTLRKEAPAHILAKHLLG